MNFNKVSLVKPCLRNALHIGNVTHVVQVNWPIGLLYPGGPPMVRLRSAYGPPTKK